MLGRTKTKKNAVDKKLFKKEAYIPKKRLQKKERTVTSHPGQRKGKEESVPKNGTGRKILVILLWIFFFGEVGYVVFFADFFTITNVEIHRKAGNAHIGEEKIREYIEQSWQGKWYGLVPKNNLLLFQPAREERRVLERYPKLEVVSIVKKFPHTLQMEIQEKSYQVLWCSKEDCFLVNKEGVTEDAHIFFQYPEEQGRAIRIQDQAGLSVQTGAQVLEEQDRRFMYDFAENFTLRTGLEVEGALERPNVYAREIRVRTTKGFSLFFNTHLSLEESLNTLMLVLTKEIPEGEWGQIDYIDLRTENRIYYTRKDRAPEKTEVQKQREEEEERKRKEEEEKQNTSGMN